MGGTLTFLDFSRCGLGVSRLFLLKFTFFIKLVIVFKPRLLWIRRLVVCRWFSWLVNVWMEDCCQALSNHSALLSCCMCQCVLYCYVGGETGFVLMLSTNIPGQIWYLSFVPLTGDCLCFYDKSLNDETSQFDQKTKSVKVMSQWVNFLSLIWKKYL